jgi:hypothetical protein
MDIFLDYMKLIYLFLFYYKDLNKKINYEDKNITIDS